MCGIAGFVGAPSAPLLQALSDSMRHRGPDDHGEVTDAWATIVSRRLAIIDVAGGHQPMTTAGGRLHIAYNGEVYNFRELREELRARGAVFQTEADTEVVLRAYELDGPRVFRRLNGMFAFALLDLRGPEPELLLVRDQLGIKPLYHASVGDRLLFSSEIKSLVAAPGFRAIPNEQAIQEYLRLGLHDHSDQTFFAGVEAVPAGHYLVIRQDGMSRHRYWEPRLSEDGDPSPAHFWALFRRAVERRLVADVPIGSCLSGGLDSSSIVCAVGELLREHAPDAVSVGDRLKTFSAVFPGDPIDERHWIDAVLAATEAEPHFIEPTAPQLMTELGDLVWTLDEPVVSSGPYAQWAVMRLAQGKVKVLLDGQGGDELLGGYTPYRFVYLLELIRERRVLEIFRQGLSWLELRTLLRGFVRPWGQARLEPMRYLRSGSARSHALRHDDRVVDDLKRRLLQDLTTYSLPSLLRYEDRISMSRSIESRVPFLDLELVEHVLSLPSRALMRGRLSRAIFRQAIKGHVPETVRLRRKKIGFTTPEMRWLRQERAAVLGVLRSPSFVSRPYWDGAAIADAFEAMCEGRMEESLFFWRVLNLELWLRVFFDRAPAEAARAPGPAWERIGDEKAAALLGTAAAYEVLAAEPARPGRHLFATAPDGSVFARFKVSLAPDQLRASVRTGDVVAFRAAPGLAEPREAVDRLLAELGVDGIGVIAVRGSGTGSTVVASAGRVTAAVAQSILADDPLAPSVGEAPGAIVVRPVGRLEADD